MRILIIGSKGFIGSQLHSFYSVNSNNTVIGCDVKSDPDNLKYIQVEKFNSDFDKLFIANEFDVCVYAGGNGSVPYSLQYPEIDYHLNTFAINRILTAIHKHQPRCKFVHISSAAVYGSPEKLPITEADEIKPLSPYGWHKFMSEIICKKYNSLYNIPTVSLRVFSVYGEGIQKQLFWDIYQKIIKTKNITLFGTGNESRDFIYISDLIHAIDILIHQAKFQGEVYNVASGTESTIKEASTVFCTLFDKNVTIFFGGETKPGDPINWRADISKIKKLGFQAKVELKQGLEHYTSWLKENESL